jgi:hypothetical protein
MDKTSRKGSPCAAFLLGLLAVFPISSPGAEPGLPAHKLSHPQISPGGEHRLRFSPRPRQTLVYSLQTRMDSEGQSFLGKSLTLSAQADGEVDVFIRQVSTDSVFTELSSPGIRVYIRTPARQDEFTLKNPPDSPVEMSFDRAGRIRDIKNTETLEDQNPLNFSILEMLRSYWPAFPDRPLAVGESWPDHKRIVVPFQGMNLTIELDITFTLNDVVPAAEGRQALVTAAYTASLSGNRQVDAFKGSFEGSGTGTGSLVFQVESGIFSDYRFDYLIDGAMVIRKDESRLAEWPFRLTAGASLLLLEWR